MNRTNEEENRMRATSLMLPRTLTEALDAQAEREGVQSRAAVIRRACTEYLRRNVESRLQEAA